MKRFFIILFASLAAAFFVFFRFGLIARKSKIETVSHGRANRREISGIIKKGETLFDVFKKSGLALAELFKIKEASASVQKLSELHPGHSYKIIVGNDNRVRSFIYRIDDDSMLNVRRENGVFEAEKKPIAYEKRTGEMYVVVRDNLISSMGSEDRRSQLLAFQLSDIFAWDLDFATDLRNGDIFKVVVEKFYRNGEFRKYGDILSAEFTGNEGDYRAYRFEDDGKAKYYGADGRPLEKAFLKTPLSFRRISSGFSLRRLNPILKIYRPHYGVDYAAPMGTPVSAVGNGTVIFSGRMGEYGNLIIIRHWGGYTTRYGHLSRMAKGIRTGVKVTQGEIIGYVGETGLATGPHLHFEIRIDGKPVNPLLAKIPRANPLSGEQMAEFRAFRDRMNNELASIRPPIYAAKTGLAGQSSRSI
ncbi:MAG: peptidoglycan DD-metalloendopeptidase family protein [Nitrospiraceae bacterium]|nr:peptidoglycan DD-metalloendopeptidase family protein [Nitrospiraceae bacterium]